MPLLGRAGDESEPCGEVPGGRVEKGEEIGQTIRRDRSEELPGIQDIAIGPGGRSGASPAARPLLRAREWRGVSPPRDSGGAGRPPGKAGDVRGRAARTRPNAATATRPSAPPGPARRAAAPRSGGSRPRPRSARGSGRGAHRTPTLVSGRTPAHPAPRRRAPHPLDMQVPCWSPATIHMPIVSVLDCAVTRMSSIGGNRSRWP